jgi:putative peptidoglycan lipid II flippase
LLNAEGASLMAALAPALMNAILLVALLVAALPRRDGAGLARHGSASAVSLTGLAHLALILWACAASACRPPGLRWSPDMTLLVRTGGATLLAASAGQLVLLVATQIASPEPGSVSALYYADRVFQLPLSFVGVAMGTVVLSAMATAREADARCLARPGAGARAGARRSRRHALYVLAEPIVSVLFEHGPLQRRRSRAHGRRARRLRARPALRTRWPRCSGRSISYADSRACH